MSTGGAWASTDHIHSTQYDGAHYRQADHLESRFGDSQPPILDTVCNHCMMDMLSYVLDFTGVCVDLAVIDSPVDVISCLHR